MQDEQNSKSESVEFLSADQRRSESSPKIEKSKWTAILRGEIAKVRTRPR